MFVRFCRNTGRAHKTSYAANTMSGIDMGDIHLIKLVVGVESIAEFHAMQPQWLVPYDGRKANVIWTRHKPKRAEELLGGGSVYRVIKNHIAFRQRILGFEEAMHPHKGKMCLIMVDPEMIVTVTTPRRAFQGWRYLDGVAAPADTGAYTGGFDAQGDEVIEEALLRAGLL